MMRNSREREEKQQKRNKRVVGIFITVIMVGSTLGFFIADNQSNNLDYKSKTGKKYSFEQANGQLYTKINKQTMAFYSHPLDVVSLNVSDEANYLLKSAQAFYMTFDPESNDIQYIEQARFDLEKDFAGLKKYALSGVIKNSTLYSNYNIITCENSTAYTPVIYFVDVNVTDTIGYVKDSCIIFEGKRTDFLKFRDYIVYKMYDMI